MRKIDQQAYNAFINKQNYNSSNTRVEVNNGESYMYLFGNLIAKTEYGETLISSGGYRPSVTTRSRLSMFVNISICKGKFVINNKYPWNGEWININNFDDNY